MQAETPPYLTAAEAAAELNVSRATLYAYVSRGLIRSEQEPGKRTRRYRADDVRSLRGRREGASAENRDDALNFGAPLLESAITLIADGGLYYRGRDVVALAKSASVESVARLLWGQDRLDPFTQPPPAPPADHTGLDGLPRCQSLFPVAAAGDLRAYNLEPSGVAATGARILRLVVGLLAGGRPTTAPLERQLAGGWGCAAAAAEPLLRMALILCADHELNASAFAVRVVAATRATPYGAVLAGLAALQGPRHGGQAALVTRMLEAPGEGGTALERIAGRLQRGEPLPGFGHPLYPDGDVRARALLDALRDMAPDAPTLADDLAVAAAVAELTGRAPNVDFALALLARALSLPAGAPLALFAIGRVIGWIAHAQEQYRTPGLIRPRARYTGDHPRPAKP
ncbi:MAG: citrate/2-methylcitrate synthase [Alphaproteobacteria bacterium]